MIEYVGADSIDKLAGVLRPEHRKVFLVTGKSSYRASGAQKPVNRAFKGKQVLQWSEFGALPLQEDIEKGIQAYRAFGPDLVVVVGGGHVMDTAKAINHYAGKKPLIAIPTTAGSGSESTHFAVVYKDGLKYSLAGEDMLPTVAIIDPALAQSVPKEIAIPSALDALAQGVESWWSKGATKESKKYSLQALKLVWKNIIPALEKRDSKAIAALAEGAHLAGKAINISKTTACHALSYGLTYRFGLPHGIAVAVFLPALMRHNDVVLPEPEITPEAVESMLEKLGIMGVRRYGVKASDVPALAAEVNTERLGNNPRAVTKEDIARFYTEIL